MNCRWCKGTGKLTLATTVVDCSECHVTKIAEYIINSSAAGEKNHLDDINPLMDKLGTELITLYILAPISMYSLSFYDGVFHFRPIDKIGKHRGYWFKAVGNIKITKIDNYRMNNMDYVAIQMNYNG